jgi:hypothetical protein
MCEEVAAPKGAEANSLKTTEELITFLKDLEIR